MAINLAVGCGHCRWCLRGYRMLCADWQCMGFDFDGGDAELMVVPAVNCMPIPDSMSFDAACVATDMIGTQYSIQKRLDTSGTDTIAVFGTGPMGGAAIFVGKARGARVIALDVLDSRLDYARGLGADEVLDARDPDIAEQRRELTDGVADVALDCAGKPDGGERGARRGATARSRGVRGESRSTTVNPSDQWLRKMTTVLGAWYFATWEWPEIVDFITHHEFSLRGRSSPIDTGLDEAEEAFRAFDARETGKAIFTPWGGGGGRRS